MVKLRYLEHATIMIKNNRQYRHTDIFIAQCLLVITVTQIVMDSYFNVLQSTRGL